MDNQLKVSLENIIPLTEARDHFSQIVSEVQKDKLYVLTKGGKPAVAIVDVKYLEHITGGELKKEHVQEEIKKAPEKAGLAPMVEHTSPRPAMPPVTAPQPTPPPPISVPKQPLPQTNIPKSEPPKPAGFAAPQPPKPPTVSPPPPSGTPSGPSPLQTPPVPTQDNRSEKIDVQFYNNESETPPSKAKIALDDKTPPAQYAGESDKEPEDMALD